MTIDSAAPSPDPRPGPWITGVLRDPLAWAAVLAAIGSVALFLWEPNQAWGMPAHPLAVHVPVIFVPVLTILVVLGTLWPRFRHTYGVAIAALAVASLYGIIVTVGAGKAFRKSRGEQEAGMDAHARFGEQARAAVAVLALLFIGLVLIDRLRRRQKRIDATHPARPGKFLVLVLSVLSSVAALGSTYLVVRAGHTGAQLVWHRGGPRGGFDGFRPDNGLTGLLPGATPDTGAAPAPSGAPDTGAAPATGSAPAPDTSPLGVTPTSAAG